MTWQWQPLLPGAAQLQAGGATTYAIQLSPASFAYTPSSLSVSTKRVVTLSPASFAYTANDLTVAIQQATTYSIELLPASFSYTPSALEVSATGQDVTTLGPGWGERTYRLEWRDRKWVKRKEREDELSNLIRQVYARLSGETEAAEAEAVETAAAEVAEVLAPYTVEESIDWEGLEANARAIADLEDALEAYIKARDEEEDFLLLMAA